MISYGPLAEWYDKLTSDIPYEVFADFYENIFRQNNGDFSTLLDFCCGTGTLTCILANRGYEMIATDGSEDMLMEAKEKAADLKIPPLFLCQEATELDLYGTVDAAICSLDGIDYIPPEDLAETFHRLHLFIRPSGLIIFDVKTPESFHSLDGKIFVDETDDVLCLWRADFDEDENAVFYGMDIFSKKGELWKRDCEEHIEYAHEPQMLKDILEKSGFSHVSIINDCPQCSEGRIFISAIRSENNG